MTITMALSLVLPFTASAEVDETLGSLTIMKYEMPTDSGKVPMADFDGGGHNQTTPTIEDEDKGNYIPEDATPVEGVEYTIKRVESFDGKNWEEITGETEIKGTTNSEGKIVFSDLPLGRYEVQETDAPDSVIMNTDKFHVDIPMTYNEGKDLAYDVTIYPKNETVMGDVQLSKKTEDGTTALGNVKFGLYEEDGTQVGEDLVTDTDGLISVEGLTVGKYYFQELETTGNHALNNTKINFEVKKTGDGREAVTEIVFEEVDRFTVKGEPEDYFGEIVATNHVVPEVEKDVEGKQEHNVDRTVAYDYNITLTAPKNITEYTALGFHDVLDDRLEYVADSWTVTGADADNITFTQDGQELKWDIKDLSALKDGQEIKVTFQAKIKADANLAEGEAGIPNQASISFDNGRGETLEKGEKPTDEVIVTPNDGGLGITKVDKDSEEVLAGAEFKLTHDKAGEEIVETEGTTILVNGEVYGGALENLTTGVDGKITITGLTPKTYYLHETKAPTFVNEDGETVSYRLLTKPFEVEVANSADNTELTVENAKSGFNLPATGGIGALVVVSIATGLVIKGRKKSEEDIA